MSEVKKVALVTGGSRGIGKAIVKELAANQYTDIIFSDIVCQDDNFDGCAKEIESEIGIDGVKIHGFKADASKFNDAQATIDFIMERFGRLDVLVNNAGITKDNLLLRMNEDEFDLVININLKSVFNYTKAAIRPMIKQKAGAIVNIASVVGITGNAGQANYSASKAGVIGFTKTMAKELASRNINVNAVAPGFIETPMTAKLNEDQKEALQKNIPLARLGKPEDIAKVVRFLSSTDANYITGQVITVDGGMVM